VTLRLTREQLYELVWPEAMSRICKAIGISDVAIAKHCGKADIPIPERGYWNKLHAGQKVTRTPLPPRDLATINLIEMGGALPPELKARITGEPGIDGEPENIDVLTERFRKRLGKVSLSRDLTRADPAIAKLLNRDETIHQKMAASSFHWEKPRFESSYERRRLRILNSIFLAFARVGGGSAYIRDREAREISIRGPAGVSITLGSPKKRQARNRRSDDADAKDKLELRAEGGRHHPDIISSWMDDDAGKLEDKLTEIVIGLAVVSERESRRWQSEMATWQRKREEGEAEARRKAKEKAEREERERIAAEEKARRDGLLTEAKNWRNARLIREYVEARRRSEVAQVPEFEKWARWALEVADQMDPLFNIKSNSDIEGVKIRPSRKQSFRLHPEPVLPIASRPDQADRGYASCHARSDRAIRTATLRASSACRLAKPIGPAIVWACGSANDAGKSARLVLHWFWRRRVSSLCHKIGGVTDSQHGGH
jgi:hypothetical protein